MEARLGRCLELLSISLVFFICQRWFIALIPSHTYALSLPGSVRDGGIKTVGSKCLPKPPHPQRLVLRALTDWIGWHLVSHSLWANADFTWSYDYQKLYGSAWAFSFWRVHHLASRLSTSLCKWHIKISSVSSCSPISSASLTASRVVDIHTAFSNSSPSSCFLTWASASSRALVASNQATVAASPLHSHCFPSLLCLCIPNTHEVHKHLAYGPPLPTQRSVANSGLPQLISLSQGSLLWSPDWLTNCRFIKFRSYLSEIWN